MPKKESPTSPKAAKASPEPPKTSGETSGESGASPRPEIVPQPHGGGLLRGGIKGHRGAGGRPPDKLKEKWEASLNRPTTMRSINKILKNPDHPHFPKVLVALADRTRGRPGVQVKIPGQDGEGDILVSLEGIE